MTALWLKCMNETNAWWDACNREHRDNCEELTNEYPSMEYRAVLKGDSQ